jgi:hypothetical protein
VRGEPSPEPLHKRATYERGPLPPMARTPRPIADDDA